jgi:hypothetical protein
MDIQEIEVEIDAQGQVNLHVKGIPGTDCLLITQDLEKALGNVVLERNMTAEASMLQDADRVDEKNKAGLNH